MTARAPLTDAEITLALKVAREEWSENDLMVQAIRDLQQARADLAALRAAAKNVVACFDDVAVRLAWLPSAIEHLRQCLARAGGTP